MSNYNDFNKSYNPNINLNSDLMNGITNENFINIAKTIDLDNLNGTNIMDLSGQNNNFSLPQSNSALPNSYQNTGLTNQQQSGFMNPQTGSQDKHLIKSITKELINNLKENNISLRDENTSSYSKNKYSDVSSELTDLDDLEEDEYLKKKLKNKKHEYKDELKKGIENIMVENGLPKSSSSYIFDEIINFKEYIILFGIYFLLSQEMVKDLFAQYFTSLNPDDMGRIQVKGVIIYGLVLTVLFAIFKKII